MILTTLERRSEGLSFGMLGLMLVGAYALSILPYLLLPSPVRIPTHTYSLQGVEVSREEYEAVSPPGNLPAHIRRMIHSSEEKFQASQTLFGRTRYVAKAHAFWLVMGLIVMAFAARTHQKKFGQSPLRPILSGLVLGFVLAAVVLFMRRALGSPLLQQSYEALMWPHFVYLACSLVVLAMLKSWRNRVLGGHCQKCGYLLRGFASPVCPECGTGFDPVRVDAHYAEKTDQEC